MIPVLEIDNHGNVRTLYTDEIDLYAIGEVTNVRRASNLEFNEENQEWEVISAATGAVVHRNKNRTKAIEWEIEHFGPGGDHYES